jgi:hypothetical protein
MRRQLRQLNSDFIESQADPLCENDERDPAQDCPGIASLSAAGALGRDQPTLLVKPERGGCHSASASDLSDQQQIIHLAKCIDLSS